MQQVKLALVKKVRLKKAHYAWAYLWFWVICAWQKIQYSPFFDVYTEHHTSKAPQLGLLRQVHEPLFCDIHCVKEVILLT